MYRTRVIARGLILLGLCGVVTNAAGQPTSQSGKIPMTTTSDEARRLFVEGRDLAEKLRATDARRLFERAVARDKDFALAHVGFANTAGTAGEFFDAVARAAALASRVSEGERHLILGLEAGAKGDPAGQRAHYTALVTAFPNDERAHMLLGAFLFGRQEYKGAVDAYIRATEINPSFSPPYNQLGYAHRFLGQYADAEGAFKKYIQLIPDDPNPYDSYAELLMKMGRFEESIENYEKALSIDKYFVASYVGIGNNYLYMGRHDQARSTFAKIATIARTTGERRLVPFWTSATYVSEGATDKALAELKKNHALAEAAHDMATMSGDLNQMGDVLREAGRLDEALARYAESVAVIEKAQIPDDVKAATRRNHLFEEGRVAVARNDLASAKAKAAEYAKQVSARKIPFEVRQQHELAGAIALAEKRYPAAVDALMLANQQDPRVLYLMALALRGAGDAERARAFADKAAKFNGLNFNYAFIATKARALAGS